MGLCLGSYVTRFTDKGNGPGVRQTLDKGLVTHGLRPELMIEVDAHKVLDVTLLFQDDQYREEGGRIASA